MADNKVFTIQGVEFSAPFRYAAGHVLTEIEAKVLNQTRFENLRNNFAGVVKASLEGKEGSIPQADLPAKFAEYEAAYEFAAPGTGTGARALDPVEKEAKALATELVKAKLKEIGRSYTAPKEATDEEKAAYRAQIDAKIAEVAEREAVVAQARKNVASRAKSLSAIAEGLDL